jgi:ubiquinol-cytochrome c reductase cytochrome c1 subunit
MGFASAGLVGSGAALAYGESLPLLAEEEVVHPPHQPWSHSGKLDTFDSASIRRGYEVYKQVCAACHSMERIAFRNLVDVIYSEDEMKAIAAEYDCKSLEPNDEGQMFKRPGKLSDYFPSPYENEQESRAANAGAYPPDLTVITKARHGGEDYIFALLTGYCDPPAGVTMAEGQHYNPYFPNGAIGMQAPLYDEVIEYEDGTPATTSQLAKDVSTFLAWAAEPEHDQRKMMGLKATVVLSLLTVLAFYYKRHKWASLKTRRISYKGTSY